MRELEVNMNYPTGTRDENNCRIVTAGSELDRMYQKTYEDYMRKTANVSDDEYSEVMDKLNTESEYGTWSEFAEEGLKNC